MNPRETDSPAYSPSWLMAVARAFHPARWGLCLLASAASLLLGFLVWGVSSTAGWQWQTWWQQPFEEMYHLGEHWFERSPVKALFGCGVLIALLAWLWGLVGGWITRSEFLWHRAAREPDDGEAPLQATPTRFVRARANSLGTPLLLSLLFVSLLFLPSLLFAVVGRLPLGIGALLLSLLLPVLWLASLAIVLVLLGGLSYGLMPATIAAEGSDHFDALSRAYSYSYQCPLGFAWWEGISLSVASLPFLGARWLHGQSDLLEPEWWPPVQLAALALSLSLFWTLQSLVYLKLRRVVDDVPENEIWDGPVERAAEEAQPQLDAGTATPTPAPGATGAPAAEAVAPPQSRAAEGRPKAKADSAASATAPAALPAPRTSVGFRDTLRAGGGGPMGLLALLLGAIWTALSLAVGAWIVAKLAPGGDGGLTPEGVWEAVGQLAGQRPLLLCAVAAGVVLVGAAGLAWPVKMAARLAAVSAVYGKGVPLAATWPFVQRTRGRGVGSVLLVTAGTELYLVAGLLVPLALQGKCGWEPVVGLGGFAAAFLGLGAFGLGAVAVEGQRPNETRKATMEILLGNGVETLGSAAVNLVVGATRSVGLVGLFWLAWLLMATTLSWGGGEKAGWVRWGLDGTLRPEADGVLYQAASWIAGLWFLLLFGPALMYPVAYALRWGVAAYLLARQQTEEIPPSQFALAVEEQAALESGLNRSSEKSRPP
jgi:hypothetical protein